MIPKTTHMSVTVYINFEQTFFNREKAHPYSCINEKSSVTTPFHVFKSLKLYGYRILYSSKNLVSRKLSLLVKKYIVDITDIVS